MKSLQFCLKTTKLWLISQLKLGLPTWVIGSVNLIEIFPLSLPQKTKIATSAQPWQPWMENYNFLLYWLHCNLKRCNKTKVNILPVLGSMISGNSGINGIMPEFSTFSNLIYFIAIILIYILYSLQLRLVEFQTSMIFNSKRKIWLLSGAFWTIITALNPVRPYDKS